MRNEVVIVLETMEEVEAFNKLTESEFTEPSLAYKQFGEWTSSPLSKRAFLQSVGYILVKMC